MSTTSLVRTESRGAEGQTSVASRQQSRDSYTSALSPSTPGQTSRQQPSSTSSPLAAAASVLPKLNLTPKSSPTTPSSVKAFPGHSTPGQWQHPRMDEVIRRQSATRFDGSNLRIIGMNTALIIASFLAPAFAHNTFPTPWLRSLEPYSLYTLYLIRAFFAVNIACALAPLLWVPDACEDIPLTPAQRHLMGLPPMSRPATPQEQQQYLTPPRYTPQSGSKSRSVSGSPSGLRPASEQRRRLSFQSSPLGSSELDAAATTVGSPFSTPTKTNSNKASVGLNSKWLYDKGRGSPRTSTGGGGGLTGFGGTGSVFM